MLSGSLSYMLAETFDWPKGLDKKFYEAKPFYYVIIISMIVGLFINVLGISPVEGLLYSAILYGITSPVIILIVLHISNNRAIMGAHVNSKLSNIAGIITLVLMTAAAVALFCL